MLLNQVANLRLRLDLRRRLSDGVQTPAALEMAVAVERYEPGTRAYAPLLEVAKATLLDLDLIHFLQGLEALLDAQAPPAAPEGQLPSVALEASVDPAIAVRLLGGPEAFLVEVGIDLLNVLHPVAGTAGERGADLALFRFSANARAALAFSAGLLAEFARFPTDPSRVDPGVAG